MANIQQPFVTIPHKADFFYQPSTAPPPQDNLTSPSRSRGWPSQNSPEVPPATTSAHCPLSIVLSSAKKMGFFRRIAGIFGIGKYEPQEARDQEGEDADADDGNVRTVHGDRASVEPIPGAPRKGFSVPVKVAVERTNLGPLIVPCDGDGGVQGLRWYAKRLRMDEDGDVADEFLDQVSDDTILNVEGEPKPPPRFQVKYSARPVKVRIQAMSLDGKLQQCVDCRGRLTWV